MKTIAISSMNGSQNCFYFAGGFAIQDNGAKFANVYRDAEDAVTGMNRPVRDGTAPVVRNKLVLAA